MVKFLPRVKINNKWYFQDNRLREFRAVDNPHDRITFKEYRQKGLTITEVIKTTYKIINNK
jgi:hypothetical protein